MNEKVLVVDDNDANRTMMVDVLNHWGYRTIEAAQGMEAMERACRELPDIVLLDVMLPGMNGYEVCRQLKKDQQMCGVPIIMLTVLDDSEARTRAINVGADLFISKPPNYKELHKNIESLLINSKKFREMESLVGFLQFLEALVRSLSPAAFERAAAIGSYGLRTAKLLGLDDDQCQRLQLCGLVCALEPLVNSSDAGPGSLAAIVEPLNLSSWMSDYLAYQRNPVVANAPDPVPVVYYMCEKYQGLIEDEKGPEEALSQLGSASSGHPAQERVLEALAQTIRDEIFLSSL